MTHPRSANLFLLICLTAANVPAALLAQSIDQPVGATSDTWPSSISTGAPAGTKLALHNGNLAINTSGAVVSNVDVRGTILINAPDVTLKNCVVTAANFVVIKIANVRGVTVQDCTINGTGFGNDGSHGIQGTGTFLRNNIFNVENGITVDGSGPTIIRDNYIHNLLASGSPHYDGIQIDGGIANVTIEHNTVINRHIQTSAVMIDNYYGAVTNIKVNNNLLAGGSYTIYVDGQFSKSPISDVSIVNNRMARGYYGIVNFNRTRPIYRGNTNDAETLIRAATPEP
jgi:hypothetical protein